MCKTKKLILLASALVTILICVASFSGLALASGGGGHGGGPVELNWWKSDKESPPIGWFIVDFFLMATALFLILRKPISSFFQGRRETLSDQISEAKKLREEIDAKSAEIDRKLNQIDAIAAEIAGSFAKRGIDEKNKLLDSAEKMKGIIEASTKLTIEREIESAKTKIRAEVTAQAALIAEDLLKKQYKAEDDDRLVKEFVSRLSELKVDKVH